MIKPWFVYSSFITPGHSSQTIIYGIPLKFNLIQLQNSYLFGFALGGAYILLRTGGVFSPTDPAKSARAELDRDEMEANETELTAAAGLLWR